MSSKILFLHTNLKNKGGWSRAFNLAAGLAAIGEQVTLITTQSKGFVFPYKSEEIQNVKVVSFPEILPEKIKRLAFGFMSIILKRIYLKNKTFDVLYTTNIGRPSGHKVVYFINKKQKMVVVSEWWDYYGVGGQYENKNKWFKLLYGKREVVGELEHRKKMDGVVCLSHFMKQRGVLSGLAESKVGVVTGGCDIEQIKYYENPIRFRNKFGLDEKSFIVGFVGMNEGEIKDIEPFLYALKDLKTKNNIKLLTTGQELSERTKTKYNLNDSLIEFGWLDYSLFPKLLSCCDLFLLLQRENLKNMARWPNKLGDYLAAGRMIITNPISEVELFVKKYPEGFICVEYDPTHLSKEIEFVLKDKHILRKGGKYNRMIAEKHESWTHKATEAKSFYDQLLNDYEQKDNEARY